VYLEKVKNELRDKRAGVNYTYPSIGCLVVTKGVFVSMV